MIKAFQELGGLVATNLSKMGKGSEAFTKAATAAMLESDILNKVHPDEIASWLASSEDVPEQHAKDFGQPPINVYNSGYFHIQVLYWVDATTALHQHAFAGAFGVLAGSSVHSQYHFELQRELSREFRLGDVSFISSELLRQGDVRPICAGSSFIHALFHLDRPSLSVVVRTHWERVGEIQYSYLKPHIAYDPFDTDKIVKTRLQLLGSLRITRSGHFWKCADLILKRGNPLEGFQVISNAYQLAKDHAAEWQELLDHATKMYGTDEVERMIVSIDEETRSRKLEKLRSKVHDVDHRFFLALLLNVPNRDTLLSLVGRRFKTEEPHLLVIRWIRELFEKELFASKYDPRLLDLLDLVVLHGSFHRARAAVLASNGIPEHLSDEQSMQKLWEMGKAVPFLKPLFDSVEDTQLMEEQLSVSSGV